MECGMCQLPDAQNVIISARQNLANVHEAIRRGLRDDNRIRKSRLRFLPPF
jgi:hypothetical protein